MGFAGRLLEGVRESVVIALEPFAEDGTETL